MQQMTDPMTRLAQAVSHWVKAEARPLQEIEAQLVHMLHDLGTSLLTALLPLAARSRAVALGAAEPSASMSCQKASRRDHASLVAIRSHGRGIRLQFRRTARATADACVPGVYAQSVVCGYGMIQA